SARRERREERGERRNWLGSLFLLSTFHDSRMFCLLHHHHHHHHHHHRLRLLPMTDCCSCLKLQTGPRRSRPPRPQKSHISPPHEATCCYCCLLLLISPPPVQVVLLLARPQQPWPQLSPNKAQSD